MTHPNQKTQSIRFSPEAHAQISARAAQNGRSFNAEVNILLAKSLELQTQCAGCHKKPSWFTAVKRWFNSSSLCIA